MASSCIICHNSAEKSPDCVLFPFPDKVAQPAEYEEYLELCELDDSSLPHEGALYICSTHFEPDCFEDGAGGGPLKEGAVPSLQLERLELETYGDDFQMLEEYAPMYSIKQAPTATVTAPVDQPMEDTGDLLVPKDEPMEDDDVEEVVFADAEVKTEAPDVDEGLPDPFDNLDAGSSSSDAKCCILCGDKEATNTNCRLYVFPRKIPKIYRKWMLAAGLNINQYKNRDIYSCQRHFPENGFFADGKFIQSWATPKLNLPVRKGPVEEPEPAEPSEPQMIFVNSVPGTSSGGESSTGPQIIIKSNPQNRKNAKALNIDPDSYAKTFAKVVMELMPRKLNYNGEDRPVTGTIVFQSNLF